MHIAPEIVEKHYFKVLKKANGHIHRAIFHNVKELTQVVKDPDVYVWVQVDDDDNNSWYWWSKNDFKEKFVLPAKIKNNDKLVDDNGYLLDPVFGETTPAKEPTYITRYVIDIEWEGVRDPYGGANGSCDCGTVLALEKFLNLGIEKDLISLDDEPNLKAVRADWVSYVTNVKHPTPLLVPDGKALHSKLRESKGLIA
jgi:hypothetical protein